MAIYFTTSISHDMLPDRCQLIKKELDLDDAKILIGYAIPCFEESQFEMVKAMCDHFNFRQVNLSSNSHKKSPIRLWKDDTLILMVMDTKGDFRFFKYSVILTHW